MNRRDDRVRAYLRVRGCAKHVVDGGLDGLVAKWTRFARELAEGYDLGLDDYLDEVDVRQILADALGKAEADAARRAGPQLSAADDLFRAATTPSTICLWGRQNALDRGYTADGNWWYFAVPKQHHAGFAAELQRIR